MITELSVHGYKSLLDVNLQPGRLNVLVGANASGKSSIIQTLLLLRQSAKGKHIVSTLELSGGLFEAGTTRDVINPEFRSGIRISLDEDENGASSEATFSPPFDSGESRQLTSTFALELPNALEDTGSQEDFAYLSAERIGPRVVYQLPMPGSNLAGPVGMHGEFTTAFLARCQQANKPAHADWFEVLSKTATFMPEDLELDTGAKAKLKRLDLAAKQLLGWIIPGAEFDATEHSVTDSAQLLYVRDPSGTRTSVRPTHMGFGITYTIPVIAAALALRKAGLLLIENPEAHLHPLSQSRIGTFLALASSVGPQVFVETHSDHFVNGVRLAIKGGLVKPGDVRFYYCTKRVKNDSTRVTALPVSDEGRILKWPEGFFDQMARDLARL